VLCQSACAWVGLALSDDDIRRRTSEFAAMFEGASSIGLRGLRGHLLRRR
jgi:fatty-acid peroxygenase